MAVSLLTLQFLDWIESRPRSYAEVMDAWRSTCPRMTVWEDSIADGLVRYAGRREDIVTLTAAGRAALAAARDSGAAAKAPGQPARRRARRPTSRISGTDRADTRV